MDFVLKDPRQKDEEENVDEGLEHRIELMQVGQGWEQREGGMIILVNYTIKLENDKVGASTYCPGLKY